MLLLKIQVRLWNYIHMRRNGAFAYIALFGEEHQDWREGNFVSHRCALRDITQEYVSK